MKILNDKGDGMYRGSVIIDSVIVTLYTIVMVVECVILYDTVSDAIGHDATLESYITQVYRLVKLTVGVCGFNIAISIALRLLSKLYRTSFGAFVKFVNRSISGLTIYIMTLNIARYILKNDNIMEVVIFVSVIAFCAAMVVLGISKDMTHDYDIEMQKNCQNDKDEDDEDDE